jgi:glycogen debranching enzyme
MTGIVLALAAAAVIPRFERPPSEIALTGPARPFAYMEASGRRAAFLGREDGSFEAWVYPLKILHGFELSFEIDDYTAPIAGAALARSVDIRPEASTVRFAHSSFTVDATWLVPLSEPGGIVLLDVRTSETLTVSLRFHTDLRLMWPAGLGGQYSYWDSKLKAYVLTESLRRHAALVGSPLALDSTEQPAHNLPDAPIEIRIQITPEIAASGLVPVAIAASDDGLEKARATYDRLLTSAGALYGETFEHYRTLSEEMTRIDSPDDELDVAFEWGKVALDKGFACNPKLGCGLIAGLGPSGRSERPGFGWYFGGDAFINSWAMTAYGDFETVRAALDFLSRRQRDDGKMMHELSQGAAYIRWFEEFPYGYYHADTTPLYIVAVRDYVEASSDAAFARALWPSIRKAYDYCLSTDEDGDGLMDNSRAGLGAVETGALRSDTVLTDVFLAAAWTEATHAAAELSSFLGESDFAGAAAKAHERARTSLNERFLDDSNRIISFALLKSGRAQPELTVWPAFGLWRGVFERGRPAVEGALDSLSGSGIGADWGARMLSRESSLYGHASYNNGAVWPFLSGFAALALYAHDRDEAAWSYLEGTKSLTFLEARGYVPELLSGDRLKALDAAVPHQLFSTSGVVSPVLRGLVGMREGRLSPRIPPGWDFLRVENLKYRGEFDLEWKRQRLSREVVETLRLTPHEGGRPPQLDLELTLPPGAEPRSSRGVERVRLPDGGWRLISKAGESPLEIRYRPGIEIAAVHEPLRMGEASARLRVLDRRLEGDTYTAHLEGRRGRSYRLRLDLPFDVASIATGREVARDGSVREIEVTVPDGPGDWGPVDLVLTLRRF